MSDTMDVKVDEPVLVVYQDGSGLPPKRVTERVWEALADIAEDVGTLYPDILVDRRFGEAGPQWVVVVQDMVTLSRVTYHIPMGAPGLSSRVVIGDGQQLPVGSDVALSIVLGTFLVYDRSGGLEFTRREGGVVIETQGPAAHPAMRFEFGAAGA